jgi:hypothetical protein
MWMYDLISAGRKGPPRELPPLDDSFSPLDLRRKAIHTWNEKGMIFITLSFTTDASKLLVDTYYSRQLFTACFGPFFYPSQVASCWFSSDMHNQS